MLGFQRKYYQWFKHPIVQGQGMEEYTLTIALIGLVVILSATTNITGLLANFTSNSIHGTAQNDVVKVTSFTKPEYPFETTTIELQLSDGSKISLDGFPVNFAQSIETVGSDGTTKHLASLLRKLADQLQEEGKLDPTKADSLRLLAKDARIMARLEQKLNYALDTFHEDKAAYLASSLREARDERLEQRDEIVGTGYGVFEAAVEAHPEDTTMRQLLESGQVSVPTAITLLGFDGPTNPQSLSRDLKQGTLALQTLKPGGLLNHLLTDYNTALSDKALEDPAVRQIVAHLVQRIAQIGDLTKQVYTTTEMSTNFKTTHSHATDICRVGSATEQQATIQCSR